MAAEAWPSIRCTAFTLAPELTASEAAVCLSSCGVSPLRPTDSAASSKTSRRRHDVFLNGSGLGKYAQRIWVALAASPGSTATDLANGLDIGRRTVKKHVETLHCVGLTDHDDEARWFCVTRPLDVVAADLGNLGRSERLVANNHREQVNYDAFQRRRTSDEDEIPRWRKYHLHEVAHVVIHPHIGTWTTSCTAHRGLGFRLTSSSLTLKRVRKVFTTTTPMTATSMMP